jgi:hypothetical protein
MAGGAQLHGGHDGRISAGLGVALGLIGAKRERASSVLERS